MNERFENINLLRAYAAISVVVYHVIELMQWKTFPIVGPLLAFRIGWIGVDLFFVISGFVITRSALGLWRADPSTFIRTYWAHRLARIVPLYLLTCTLWIVLFESNFFAQPMLRALWQLAAHATFTHSFWPFTYNGINGVTWTLALEMQFYLLIAFLIPWLLGARGIRVWLACILVAWMWRGVVVYFFHDLEPIRIFVRIMQLPGAMDEFGAGIFLALWLDRRGKIAGGAAWLWGAGAIVTGVLCMDIFWSRSYWDDPAMMVFWRTLLGAFFLCVVATAVHLPPLARAWPLRPVWYLGEISYGIYLWHLFAIKLCLRIPGLTPLQALGITLGLTVLLAATSWHFLERPILDAGRRHRPRSAPGPQPAAAGGS